MDVLMPQLGETVAEGKIIQWFKSVGDKVALNENLCEIETDKVTIEVPSLIPGVLQAINVPAGTVAKVGTILAVVGDGAVAANGAGAKPAAPTQPATAPAAPVQAVPVAAPAPSPAPAMRRGSLDPYHEVATPLGNFGPARLSGGNSVTPLARRLAKKGGIDLNRIAGSGPRGRIIAKDVDAALASQPSKAAVVAAETPVGGAYRDRPHTILPIDGMRRTIARRLVESKTTIPHFYLSADVETGRLSKLREEVNGAAKKDDAGTAIYRLTITDFLVKALALALKQVPRANTIWSSDGILAFEHADVAVAVSLPDGLITPVVLDAETKSLSALSGEIKDLAARARSKALKPEEYQGGVTTLSNLGMHGVRDFAAIVNPPQSSILAVGAEHRDAIEKPDGGVAFVSRITATLSCDHRVVDGVVGAELLAAFKALAENPLQMLV